MFEIENWHKLQSFDYISAFLGGIPLLYRVQYSENWQRMCSDVVHVCESTNNNVFMRLRTVFFI